TIPNAAVQPVATPGARPTIRGELGLTNEFVVVFAGRLEPVKRIESLVRAFAEDEVALSHAHLVVAGDGSQRPVLEELVADLGLAERVRFLGHRHDVVDVIAAADCVALVSSSEGLPYVVLEAIALDRPLILSRLPALVDLLGDEGAEFVGVGDHQGTARSIMRLAGDDRLCARLARTASSRVAERLPPAQMSIATEAAYYGPHRPVDLVRMIRPDGVGFNRTFNVVRRIAPFIDRPTRVLSVLTYHRVATDEHDRCLDPVLKSATPEMFEQQMALLRRRYEPVTLADVRAALVDGHDLPAGAVLVTFDDAYRDLADHAAPILRRHGIKATVFVPTAYPGSDALDFWWDRLYRSILCSTRSALTTPIGTFVLDGSPTRASWVSNSIARHLKTLDHLAAISVVDQVVADAGQTDPWNAVMDWNQLELFLGDGHFVQSHTRTHPALDQLPIGEVETELTGSYADIVGRLGVAPIALAYPTGQSSPAVRRMIVDAGFELAFTTAPGSNRLPVEDLLSIHRIDVTASVQASHLALMLGPVASAARRLR
ncbi:MAG: glycosyltransferase, partial [Ilumatobacter sp.]